MALPSFFPQEDPAPQISNSDITASLCCPICTNLLDRPVELACSSIVCLNCCRKWIQHHLCPSLVCPCCYSTFDSSHIRPPPALLVTLEGLLVDCFKKIVRIKNYKKHLQEQCRSHYTYQMIDLPSKMTISEVLSRPTNLPATPVEKKVAEHLVKKKS